MLEWDGRSKMRSWIKIILILTLIVGVLYYFNPEVVKRAGVWFTEDDSKEGFSELFVDVKTLSSSFLNFVKGDTIDYPGDYNETNTTNNETIS